MASGSRPFYLLITLFAFIQVVAHLWPHPSAHSSQRGLVTYIYKRAEPGDSGDPQCDNVWDHSDQCAFVKEFCADYPAGLINYLYLYFCDLSSLHTLALVIMGTWMVFLFALIGIAASDYFCPNLNTIAKKLHLSESMTGVTFLAFGNASPDIFSTFSAISAGSATLAIGEVVGAASFISTVVVGSMAIGDPFRVTRVPFLRDAGFFIGCLLFTLYMVVMQKITLIDSVLLIVAYVSYVFIIVFSSWRHKRRIRIVSHQQQEWEETVRVDAALEVDPRSLIQEALDDSGRGSSEQDDLNEEELGTPSCVQGNGIGAMAASIPAAATESIVAGGHDYPDAPVFETCSRLMSLPVRPALFLQTTDFDQSHSPDKTRRCPAIVIDTTTYSSTTPQRLGREQRRNSSGYTMIKNSQSADERRHLFLDPLLGNHNDPYDDSDDEDGDNPNFGSSYTKFQQALIHHSLILPDRHDPSTHPRSPSFQGSASSFHEAVSSSSESGRGSMGQYFQDMIPDMSYKGRLRGYFQDCIKPLFFPTLLGWHEKSWILKTLAVASIPTVLLLTLTLPVVDLADSDNEKMDVTIAVGHGQAESGYLAPRIIVSGVDDDEPEAEQCPYDGWSKVTTMIQMIGAPVFITAVFTGKFSHLHYSQMPSFSVFDVHRL
ncbi:hypothetical protein BGZ99_003950 [Dissophora globulifera]|uniref:Sodium/calcium exchanger membrane region domain-containing protein n=1 Tax=Dissophora globulifera TaxID=979702 RepID=A0A9P6RJ09_9FUNG|nr:hypothetical protein BGZ99_003950 [Dissophora globulifera]